YTGDTRVDILSGSLSGGQFISNNGVHSMQMTTTLGLTYAAGPRLASILGSQRELVAPQNASFALSDVRTFTGSTQILRPDLTYESFTATPSFTGDAQVGIVPSPGAAALAGVGGLLALRRRRR
ncbi:MAG: hypothetical protein WCK33_13840, partial [Phycisphaerae bacterium]